MENKARKNVIDHLMQYLGKAEDWDVYEIVEWAFGYDDPAVEQFREEINRKTPLHESQGTDNPPPAMQS